MVTIGPYEALKDGRIKYKGNKIHPPIDDIRQVKISVGELEQRVQSLHDDPLWIKISRINHTINLSINHYFDSLGAFFIPLPLTTRMISSPGALYGKEAINYTTDTSPITLRWFDLEQPAFLAESSQIYLELALLQKGVDHVYSNYHSFRKEEADVVHLCEFRHIEYEGKVDFEQNLKIIQNLLKKIISDLISHNFKDLVFFIPESHIEALNELVSKPFPILNLKEALDLLYEDTKNAKYKKFTLQHFGFWEEVRLTQIVGGTVIVSEMPLLEVPFYHAMKPNSEPPVAKNADVIWAGYREIIGSGERIGTLEELEKKAEIFNLPKKDYAPYLSSRKFPDYKRTSGFGMGWERFLQGILEMPTILSVSLFPRTHLTLKP